MYDESHIGNEVYSDQYKCPHCNSLYTDYDGYCVECGEKVVEYEEYVPIKVQRNKPVAKNNILPCPYCNSKIIDTNGKCVLCGKMLGKPWLTNYVERETGVSIVSAQQDTNLYRTTLSGKKIVTCPKCNSTNCSLSKKERVVPDKVKTTYSANLNPFKPFTLVNKKEKVVKKGYTYTVSKYVCNNCGKEFS